MGEPVSLLRLLIYSIDPDITGKELTIIPHLAGCEGVAVVLQSLLNA